MRRQILHEDHRAILEARLLVQRARIDLGGTDAAEAEFLDIEKAAERLCGADHPLTIEVASARLDCADEVQDAALSKVRDDRLESMRARRTERLRADGG